MPSDKNPVQRWILTRKIIQATSLLSLLFIFFLAADKSHQTGSGIKIPFQLDLLTTLSHIIANRSLLAGSTISLFMLLLTIILGRAWCGWLCPLGTILDIFSLKNRNRKQKNIPQSLHRVKYTLLVIILSAAIFGNLTLLVLDPLTILFRTLVITILPALNHIVTSIERTLFNIAFLTSPVYKFDAFVRPVILPFQPLFYRDTLLYGIGFAGIIALNLITPRFWCRYICPLGGLLGVISKLSIFRRHVTSDCSECTSCHQTCPMDAISIENNFASDPGECTLCLECFNTCPPAAIQLQNKQSALTNLFRWERWEEHDPSKRHVLVSLGAAITGISIFRTNWAANQDYPFLLQPPGVHNNDLLLACIRCGMCMRACPTGALQPSIFERGAEGFSTPVLIPRLGYCDYSCNACGNICPVEAIPKISIEEKRQQIIGTAYINENLCIPWTDQGDCIVCEEMCPLPEKAIQLEEFEHISKDGSAVILQRPYVLHDQCIGCGICEYKCPVNGQEAAIRVRVSRYQA
jgi:polyferredoxin